MTQQATIKKTVVTGWPESERNRCHRSTPAPPENKDAHRGQAKENDIHRDYIVQNLFKAAGYQRNHNGQPALQRYRERRNSGAIQPGELFEKETVFGHRKINSGRGQHALTQKTNG